MVQIDLSGRKALVTGGARGIGAGVVSVLAKCGADVVFTHLDIPDDSAADELNGLDIVIPNVGVNWVIPLADLEIDKWKKGIELNLTTSFIAAKAAYPHLRKAKRGDMVFIGSSAVYDGGGGSVFYAAAKAGVEGMAFGLMREMPQENIHVNVVHPCVVDTDLLRSRYNTEEKIDKLKATVPIGRLSKPEDVGNMVAFLCSELGSFICGQSILIDGGRTMWKRS